MAPRGVLEEPGSAAEQRGRPAVLRRDLGAITRYNIRWSGGAINNWIGGVRDALLCGGIVGKATSREGADRDCQCTNYESSCAQF
jgi:hypothetical protein